MIFGKTKNITDALIKKTCIFNYILERDIILKYITNELLKEYTTSDGKVFQFQAEDQQTFRSRNHDIENSNVYVYNQGHFGPNKTNKNPGKNVLTYEMAAE